MNPEIDHPEPNWIVDRLGLSRTRAFISWYTGFCTCATVAVVYWAIVEQSLVGFILGLFLSIPTLALSYLVLWHPPAPQGHGSELQ